MSHSNGYANTSTCKYGRGKNPGSRNNGKNYKVDPTLFTGDDLTTCYYAGFIAADGNIDKYERKITIGLAEKDRGILENMKQWARLSNPITTYLAKQKYPSATLSFTSPEACATLTKRFNITKQKSLTLFPPNELTNEQKDAFIIGYMDGDGSIGLRNVPRKQKSLGIQILGTREMCAWIQTRFEEILEEPLNIIYHSAKHHENTVSLHLSDRRARKVFQHLYEIPVPKLSRKWATEIAEYCRTYTKHFDRTTYEIVYQLGELGLYLREIGVFLGKSTANTSMLKGTKNYKTMKTITTDLSHLTIHDLAFLSAESEELDKGEVDIETQESEEETV